MTYIKTIFNKNFLEYASYVIKDRAIPHIDDGLKPVQRRILHSLYEMDDGKFNKVANVIGTCMKYHPHGDQSIYSALILLANKDLFIEKQGNFGNIFTGDPPSASRYIECRLLPISKEVLFNPEITQYESSYDGRNKEPVVLPAKIPVLLIHGAEGIAVGMATKILPHNLIEVLDSVKAALNGDQYLLFPDFPTAGYADVSEYNDGNGKILIRAKLDTKDSKKIIIRELPFGTTTESLINSIESAAKKNKIKISSINDYSTDKVEIEINLARGMHTKDTVDALYAFTDCELSVSINLLVIKDEKPSQMTICEVVEYSAEKLKEILRKELLLEEKQLNDKLHSRTLERIFIEERIYKKIEKMTTQKMISKAVINGFKPFFSQIKRKVTTEDLERLLKIPIRRISLYDINKIKKEITEIEKRLTEINKHLASLVDYACSFLNKIIDSYKNVFPRRTEIISFDQVDVREAAQRNLKLKYDKVSGYLGYETNGNVLFDVSQYDRLLVIRKTGMYSVIVSPDKVFVDKGMLYCGFMDSKTIADTIFTVIYSNNSNGYTYIKRCKIEKYILNKGYSIIPEKCTLLKLTTENEIEVVLEYRPKPRLKVLKENFQINNYLVKGTKAAGVRLANKEVKSVKLLKKFE
jgi:topoisomerase-4 subunit A